MTNSSANLIKWCVTLIVATVIFIGDLVTPLGIAAGVPYVFLVLISLWFSDKKLALIFSVVATFLVLAGWFFSPPGGEVYKVLLNRTYAIGAVWAVGISLYVHLKSKALIEKQKNDYHSLSLELRQQLEVLNAAAIVSITDKAGNITHANDLFCEISGYERDELIGKKHRLLKSNHHPDGLFVGMWSAISQGRIWHGDICNKRKDGSLYWVATTIAPFYNEQDQIEKYVSVRFDITRIKEQEVRLKQYAKDLQLTNADLEAANKELELFSYCVSHDLKAPLRALQGFSKNLVLKYGGSMDENANRWLRFIESNAERMDNLITDMLDFSRISRSDIKKEKVDMDRIVRDLVNREVTNLNKPVEIEIDQLPVAEGDAAMLEMVWQNLVNNALKYSSRKEKIKIDIKSWANNGHVFYSIRDNGAGFDMRHYDKLFSLFQRLHHNEEFEGTGVGLANVQRILDKHGGEIEAKSEIDQGTEFIFKLPNTIKNEI